MVKKNNIGQHIDEVIFMIRASKYTPTSLETIGCFISKKRFKT